MNFLITKQTIYRPIISSFAMPRFYHLTTCDLHACVYRRQRLIFLWEGFPWPGEKVVVFLHHKVVRVVHAPLNGGTPGIHTAQVGHLNRKLLSCRTWPNMQNKHSTYCRCVLRSRFVYIISYAVKLYIFSWTKFSGKHIHGENSKGFCFCS